MTSKSGSCHTALFWTLIGLLSLLLFGVTAGLLWQLWVTKKEKEKARQRRLIDKAYIYWFQKMAEEQAEENAEMRARLAFDRLSFR